MTATPVRTESLTKHFGGLRALDSVDFTARAGEVTGLLGASGAGKSTLCEVLTGRLHPDGGSVHATGPSVLVQGTPALASDLTVAENLWLGIEPRRAFGLMDRTEMTRRTHSVLAHLLGPPAGGMPLDQRGMGGSAGSDGGLDPLTLAGEVPPDRQVGVEGVGLDARPEPLTRAGRFSSDPQRMVGSAGVDGSIVPWALVGELSADQQRIVELARALAVGARVVVLDDPASIVPPARLDALLTVVRRLAEAGVAVVYATQRSCELAQVADQVTVLRSGRASGPCPMSDAQDLAAWAFAQETVPSVPNGQPLEGVVLDVRQLRAGQLVEDVTFGVRSGEVVALAGVGANEVVAGLAGATTVHSGQVVVHGEPVRPRRPSDAVHAGIGYLAGESDLLASGSVGWNIAVAEPRVGWLRRSGIRRRVAMVEKLLRTGLPGADQVVADLPATERHRVALARLMLAECDILLLAEPFVADNGSHRVIRELADAGVAVVLAAGTVTDALPVADRIVLLRDGRSHQEAKVSELSTQDVIRLSAGLPCAS
jgi:ABC-type sugar transport system ATPase subunit